MPVRGSFKLILSAVHAQLAAVRVAAYMPWEKYQYAERLLGH
jgi:hypothetical protein